MTTSIQNQKPLSYQIFSATKDGIGIMLCQAPFVNGFNRISVISSDHNCGVIQSVRKIYSGVIDGKAPSVSHFGVGISPLMLKELFRGFGKSSGAFILKPSLEYYYRFDANGKLKTNAIFAVTLSVFEMMIHPIDTLGTLWQNGNSIKKITPPLSGLSLVKYLYTGAKANGGRQFGQWGGYAVSEDFCNEYMKNHTNIDPHSNIGICYKSLPQSAFLTVWFYPLQRIKTGLQTNPAFAQEKEPYKKMLSTIIKTQGFFGLFKGLVSKILSNAALVGGVNYLLEKGRKAHKANEK